MEGIKQFFVDCWANEVVRLSVHTMGRLILAALLGGIIGSERQHSHRPAGLRTHVLVAVGAALVMCTSDFIRVYYPGQNSDLSRLGAQVISGIGFLGAGTILREGFSVKGLTTAASLWAVSCVGLAVGIGFWPGALIATAVIYLTLNALKKVWKKHSSIRTIHIGVDNAYHVSEGIAEIFHLCGADLRSLEIIFPDDSTPFASMHKEVNKVLKAMAYVKDDNDLALIKEELLALEGVVDFHVES